MITGFRGRSRRAIRSTRRLVDGGLGITPVAPIAWTIGELQRRRGGEKPKGPVENSSFTWSIADDHVTTVLWLHNYWSDAYQIERPEISAQILDIDGKTLAEWQIVLEPHATHRIDVRERCVEEGIPLPFKGQVLLRMSHEKLFAARPLQVFAEYVQESGETTGVHGQYGLMDKPAAQLVGTMRVEAGDGRRTSVVVTNPYVGPGSAHSIRPELTLVSADGRKRRSRLDPIAPLGTGRTYLDDAFPGLESFLGSRPGHFRVKVPSPTSRIANFIEYIDGRMVANHGTIDRVYDQGSGMPPGWTGSTPMASTLVLCDEHRDTVISLPNHYGPVLSALEVTVKVFDTDGKMRASCPVQVEPDGFVHVPLRQELVAAGTSMPFVGHAEISLRPTTEIDEWPAQFDVLLGQYVDGNLAAEVQVGGDFINGDIPPGVKQPDIRRTRIFARVKVGDGVKTRIFLGHPSSAPNETIVAHPKLTLLDMSGTKQQVWEAGDLQPHGCLLVDIEDIFPNARHMLGESGSGAIRIRDLEARLYGYYMTETEDAITFPMCHLIGG